MEHTVLAVFRGYPIVVQLGIRLKLAYEALVLHVVDHLDQGFVDLPENEFLEDLPENLSAEHQLLPVPDELLARRLVKEPQ